MRLAILVLAMVALSGCHSRQPKMSDEQMEKLRARDPGMTEKCLDKIRWGGVEALTGKAEDCYKFDPPRRWRGLLSGAFEVSRFCPEPASECSDNTPGEHIWATAGPSVHVPPWNGDASAELFRVDFVGRKTSYPGQYGPAGYQQEVIVDRLISMKRIDLPNAE